MFPVSPLAADIGEPSLHFRVEPEADMAAVTFFFPSGFESRRCVP
jgi:hypothetical protein